MNEMWSYVSSAGRQVIGRGNSVNKILKEWKRTGGPWGGINWKGLHFWGQGEETCSTSETEKAKGESSELGEGPFLHMN